MRRNQTQNLILIGGGIIALFVGYYYVQRDRSIVDLWNRNAYTVDSIYASPDERRIAKRFSDSTLPSLRKIGLIVSYQRRDWETVITVSGPLWNERSPFFRESFLTEVRLYNKVQGLSTPTHIVDHRSGLLYATVISPDQVFLRE
ncbi:MAG: hypothetical protein WCT99_04180 [Bacteroidota bacterium]